MSTLTIDELKRDPNELIARIARGMPVTLTDGERSLAEVQPVTQAVPPQSRPIGLCRGMFRTPDDFDAPLPDDILKGFTGE